MNKYGMLTSGEELMEYGANDYNTINEVGVHRLHLDFRGWYNKGFSAGLIAYFSDEKGNKYRLYAWRHCVDGSDIYNPKKSKIDFEKVSDNTWWNCTIAKNKKGNPEWVDAEMVIE